MGGAQQGSGGAFQSPNQSRDRKGALAGHPDSNAPSRSRLRLTSTLIARFGAIARPLPYGRGSDQSRDRKGALAAGNSTISRGQRPSWESETQRGLSSSLEIERH